MKPTRGQTRAEGGAAGDPELPMAPDRWEHGSMFHLSLATGTLEQPWREFPHRFFGSGRDALRSLAAWGVAAGMWRRVVIPSYYCQDVLDPMRDELDVATYAHAPTMPSTDTLWAKSNDLILIAALFGANPAPAAISAGHVAEDHTHDPVGPAAWGSTAPYAFASLRKTLPLPDGGVLWSPLGLDLPPQVALTPAHDRATRQRLRAMTLKRHYLAGADVTKDQFRELAISAESRLGTGEVSGISSYSAARLSTLPGTRWRDLRRRNLQAFRDELGDVRGLTFLDASFAATMLFDSSAERDRVRSQLARSRVYATVYWPLVGTKGDIPEGHVELSRRTLSIHCDHRYAVDDMHRAAELLRRAIG